MLYNDLLMWPQFTVHGNEWLKQPIGDTASLRHGEERVMGRGGEEAREVWAMGEWG